MALSESQQTLRKLTDQNKVLIMAHRGTAGGNIVQNTIGAFENALKHGADIVEVDASMSTDGVFYAFHDGMEPVLLGVTTNIRTLDSKVIESLWLRNSNFEIKKERVNRLDDVLDYLKGRCLINLDRGWLNWEETIRLIKRHNMNEQIILKSHPVPEYLQALEEQAADIMFMPIITRAEQTGCFDQYKLNWVAAELIFEDLGSPVIDEKLIAHLKSKGLLLCCNPITLNDWIDLTAKMDDNHSILYGPDPYWGWCVRKGFDILQTDWPMLLKSYINSL